MISYCFLPSTDSIIIVYVSAVAYLATPFELIWMLQLTTSATLVVMRAQLQGPKINLRDVSRYRSQFFLGNCCVLQKSRREGKAEEVLGY